MGKKKIWIILAVVVILIAVSIFATIYFWAESKYNFKVEQVKQINYHIIDKEKKYGVINRNGEVVVEPIYDVIQIPNPSKPVFVCMYDYDTQKLEYKTKVLNDKGEQLYQEYQSIQAIPTETTYDGIPFEKSVLEYKKDGKYGLLDLEGKQKTEPVYDQISAIAYKEGMLLVTQDEKCGVVNMKGQLIIPVEYESIVADNYYNEKTFYRTTGFIVKKKTEEGYGYGYINYRGKMLIKPEYTTLDRVTEMQDDKNIYFIAYKDGQAGIIKNKKLILNHEYEDISYNEFNNVFVIQRNGKQGIADKNGKIILETEYDKITFGGTYVNTLKDNETLIIDLNGNPVNDQKITTRIPTSDGKHFIISDGETYKIIDENGNVVVDRNYSYIEEIEDNYYIVTNNGKNGIIDLSGKSVVDLKYNSIFEIEDTDLLQANISDTETVTLINKDMKEIVSMNQAGVEFSENYIRVYSDTENRYFDYEGNAITNKQALPNNTLYAKKIDDKWGFVDKNDELKVQNKYDMVTEFNEYGFAGIKQGEKWGVINSDGNVIQEPIYEIDWVSPTFIGKFYSETEWYDNLYYTDKIGD